MCLVNLNGSQSGTRFHLNCSELFWSYLERVTRAALATLRFTFSELS